LVIIDIHVHHVPQPFARFVEKASPYAICLAAPQGESVTLQVGALSYGLNRTFFDPERLTARMKAMRIEKGVLSVATPFVNYDVPASLGQEAAELYNNEIASLCRLEPDRFDGWAYLPMQDPALAAKELRRAVAVLGLSGGYLPSNVRGRYLDAEEFGPIFMAATELDTPLFIHPSNPPARERMAHYELAVVAGYLFDTTLNIFHMIFGGLFDRFPTLRLCCTHLGGYAPLLHARMQRELDTNPMLAGRLSRPLKDYLRAIYFDTICFEPSYVRSVVESGVVDSEHLMLGSDSPFPLGEPDPVDFVERSFPDRGAALAEQVLSRNASAFLQRTKHRATP
jgi:aminocarboxymuconate-semialdehyde decarboxylase